MFGARQQHRSHPLGDLGLPGQPRPLDAGEPGVGQPQQQPVVLGLLPRRGEHPLGDGIAAPGQQAPEPRDPAHD
jgi:hypothetical protein